MSVKSVEEYAEEYRKMSNDDLISEFGSEYWASDRCCSEAESKDSSNALEAGRTELLARMEQKKEKSA